MATPIVVKGTELKLTFTVVEPSETSLRKIKWKLIYYTGSETDTGAVTITHEAESDTTKDFIPKDNILDIAGNMATIAVDTANMNPGTLKCKATLYLDDEEFQTLGDNRRTEIQRITTNVKIIE